MFNLVTLLIRFVLLLRALMDVIVRNYLISKLALLPGYSFNLFLMAHMHGIAGGNDAFGWLFQSSKCFTQTFLDIPNILRCFPHLLHPGKSGLTRHYGITLHPVILLRV